MSNFKTTTLFYFAPRLNSWGKNIIGILLFSLFCLFEIHAQANERKNTILIPEGKVIGSSAQKDIEIGYIVSTFFIIGKDGEKIFFDGKTPTIPLDLTNENFVYIRLKNLVWNHKQVEGKTPIKLLPGNFKASDGSYLTYQNEEKVNEIWFYPEMEMLDLPFHINRPSQIDLNIELKLTYQFKSALATFTFYPRILGRTESPTVVENTETITPSDSSLLVGPAKPLSQTELDSIRLSKEHTEIDQIWKELHKSSVLPLRTFLDKYGDNPYAIGRNYIESAQSQMTAIEENVWEKAQKQQNYKRYLKFFPEGKYAKEAIVQENKFNKSNSKTPEDQLWEQIYQSTQAADFTNYLSQYPEGKYVDDAREAELQFSKIDYRILKKSFRENVQEYVIKLENIGAPKLITPKLPNQLEFDISGLSENKILKVFVKDIGEYSLLIDDVLYSKAPLKIHLNNIFSAVVDSVENNLIFKIQGGIQPYKIEFLTADSKAASKQATFQSHVFQQEMVDDQLEVTFPLSKMDESGMDGYFQKIMVRDNTGKGGLQLTKYENTGENIRINIGQATAYDWRLVALTALLVFSIGIYVIYDRVKHKKIIHQYETFQETQQEKKKMNSSDEEFPVNIKVSKRTTPSPRDTKISRTPSVRKTKTSSKIKITKRNSINDVLSLQAFNQITASNKFTRIELAAHWKDSTISDIFLHEKCILELNHFLEEENLSHILPEKEGTIPEIGGFLMGVYTKQPQKSTYKVTLHEFVPFVPEYHDVYKIEIGTDTLARELADAQDRFPELSVIGWFHTHPGHGLFLSMPDLAVQKHFSKEYQLAMEIDSLTTQLDAAFFTQKQNGSMNNSNDRLAKKWFSWVKIRQI